MSDVQGAHRDITAETKSIQEKSKLLDAPKRIGNKEISSSVALGLNTKAIDVLNEINEPSCCNRMYGRDADTLTDDQIERLNEHIPAEFLDGIQVRRETTYHPLRDSDITGHCAVPPISGFLGGSLIASIGYCLQCSIDIPVEDASMMIKGGGLTVGGSCGLCAFLTVLGLVYPCICREQETYIFGAKSNEGS